MTAPRVLAAIDCGTNSIRLLVSEVRADGTLRELTRENTIVRLGQGVDATGRFAPEALERVDAALGTYTDRMVDLGVSDVMMGATSATRDAANREDFFALTRRHLGRIREGAVAEVVSGTEDAQFSFAGAVADLGDLTDETVCVIDLGGGSTEFVVDGDRSWSADMGCVRLTERFLRTVPPTDAEVDAARAYVDGLLATVNREVDLRSVTRVVGVAGTMTTLAAIELGLDHYDAAAIHRSRLPLGHLRETARTLLHQTVEERRAHPVMHPGRADVIGGGAVVVDAVASQFLAQGIDEITVSEKDILDGMLSAVVTRTATAG